MDTVDGQARTSALLSFAAENVRSFRDGFELSLLASSVSEKRYVRDLVWHQGGKTIPTLAVSVIFGANASGKSNVLRAIYDMRQLVLHSFRSSTPTSGLPRRPFLLDPAYRGKTSTFEIDIILDGVRHQYGFSVDDHQVHKEWAYAYPKGRAALLFERGAESDTDSVKLGASNRAVGNAVRRILRPNALFLSTAASANHPDLVGLYRWFEQNLRLAEHESRPQRQALTARMLDDDSDGSAAQIRNLLKAADLGVTSARRLDIDPELRERLQRTMEIVHGRELDNDRIFVEFEELGVRLTHNRTAVPQPVAPVPLTLRTAKASAQALDRRHAGNGVVIPENNPSSSMWQLLDRVLAARAERARPGL